jgi:propanol-preferring alcohol dehydrogenase
MTSDPTRMRAMVLHRPDEALRLEERPVPEPEDGEILVRVAACGVCRTDLHVVDGDLDSPRLPLVPGHEVVGRVVGRGREAGRFREGDRVGIPWVGKTCGNCVYCLSDRENLCESARFTGYTFDGGYAGYARVDERYAVPIPAAYDDVAAAPLLCAGLIGYRSLAKTGSAERLGIYGFGAAAHIVTQVARSEGRKVFAFTRPGDEPAQAFARKLGCAWAGDSDEPPPEFLDAAIIFAPVGELLPCALAAVRPGGIVVCGGIHMSPIPSFPYSLLWGERRIESVANLTRADARRFMAVASETRIETTTTSLPLGEANAALSLLREGRVEGAIVLVP